MSDESSDELELSEKLSRLIDDALKHGVESINEGGPLVPFVFTETGDKRRLARAIVGASETEWSLEESVEKARQMGRARDNNADRVVIVFDARIGDKDGGKVDALLAEVFETDLPATLVLALPYQHAEHPDGFAILGEVEMVDQHDPLW